MLCRRVHGDKLVILPDNLVMTSDQSQHRIFLHHKISPKSISRQTHPFAFLFPIQTSSIFYQLMVVSLDLHSIHQKHHSYLGKGRKSADPKSPPPKSISASSFFFVPYFYEQLLKQVVGNLSPSKYQTGSIAVMWITASPRSEQEYRPLAPRS